jgi:hypothetical protein
MRLKVCTVGVVIPLAAAFAVSTAPVASAAAPPSAPFARTAVRDVGVCSARSEVTLEARTALRDRIGLRDRIELDLRVFTNRAGDVWRVRITQNDRAIAAQTAVARPVRIGVRPPLARRAAALTVRQVAINMRGLDRFMARATNLRTGELCTAQVTVRADRPVVRPPVRVRPPIQRMLPPVERVRPPIAG